jgi:hypothetical protein
MPRAKSTLPKPTFHLHSLKLTEQTAEELRALAQFATDATGRVVSGAGVIRALISYATRQGPRWAQETLSPLIIEEQLAGGGWGKRRQ